jgi:hypothetical protein
MYSRLWDNTITESAMTPAKVQVSTTLPNTGQATFAAVSCFYHPQVPYSKQIAATGEMNMDTARMDPPLALSKFTLQEFGNPVRCCSEVRIGKDICQCHPSFQSDGAIYDWMRADFRGAAYLCRLAAVVVSPTDESVNANDG